MIVLKFGGTSVGDAARIRTATGLVAERAERSPVVVVSAIAGVTNDLVKAADLAGVEEIGAAKAITHEIVQRHEEIAFELVRQKSDFLESFSSQLRRRTGELNEFLEQLADRKQVTPRDRDRITALGEKLSSVLFAYTLRLRTLNGVHIDSEDIIATDDQHGAARPDMDATRANATAILIPEIRRGHIPVLGGFFGRSRSGSTSTLGRGGSDYSAAIVSAAIDAEEIQIWTDVDGMMTADPRLVPHARPVDRLSFEEAAELAHHGAKVLHPETVSPAIASGIPIRILNTHNPAARGTLIAKEGDPSGRPCAIAVQPEPPTENGTADSAPSPGHMASRLTIVASSDLEAIARRVRNVCEVMKVSYSSERIGKSGRSFSIVVDGTIMEALVATLHRDLFE